MDLSESSASADSNRRTPASVPPPEGPAAGRAFGGIWGRLARGAGAPIGVPLVGVLRAGGLGLLLAWSAPATTSVRVVFTFPGVEKSEYPDHSKFSPNDVSAPEVVLAALQHLRLASDLQDRIRGAISVEGIIPDSVIKSRDRMEENGQFPPPYSPDEYSVSLTLPRNFPLTVRQRELLLNEIINVYQQNFTQTYATLPLSFGNAFHVLQAADYPDYELVLDEEMQNVIAFLVQQEDSAPSFRSRTTNLGFSDLLVQARIFTEVHLNEVLGIIYSHGLTKNRQMALTKMDYYLRTVEDQEREAQEQLEVVDDLLTKHQEHFQDYVLGVQSGGSTNRAAATVLNENVINSLIANDSYNFLIRRALDAGMDLKRIQGKKEQLIERRKTFESFAAIPASAQVVYIAQVQAALAGLEKAYNGLLRSIRETQSDFVRQQYANAIRITSGIVTESPVRKSVVLAVFGALAGLSLGLGLSLIGVSFGPPAGTNKRH